MDKKSKPKPDSVDFLVNAIREIISKNRCTLSGDSINRLKKSIRLLKEYKNLKERRAQNQVVQFLTTQTAQFVLRFLLSGWLERAKDLLSEWFEKFKDFLN